MAVGKRDDITLVLPTYNRAEALRLNLPSMLAMQDVAEVIVVDDGSSDDTPQVCAQFSADPRLRIIRHELNRGVPAARNTGLSAATGGWVLFGEDDCRFPTDYATVLRAEASRHSADILGAPLLHVPGTVEQIAAIAATAPRVDEPSMEDVGSFPRQALETPFLPARALVRRSVFEQVRFDDGFLVNAYREETDFFVQAARAGFRCLFTGETYCYQFGNWDGGAHQSSTLRYEYWAARNNWRFLNRHGAWLIEQGYIRSRTASQARFILQRIAIVLRGATRSRISRAVALVTHGPDRGLEH
ncbi:MAG TPA: glycosyltransferase family 2 protein [Solirubrobacteraceae bacterium]|nr:glycosyltransferase family 2 protein [Solirubrobacteraceae bacterium]